jgi:hypothetical protein
MHVQEFQMIVFEDIIGEWAVKNVLVEIRNHQFGVVEQRSRDPTIQHVFAKIKLHHLRPLVNQTIDLTVKSIVVQVEELKIAHGSKQIVDISSESSVSIQGKQFQLVQLLNTGWDSSLQVIVAQTERSELGEIAYPFGDSTRNAAVLHTDRL